MSLVRWTPLNRWPSIWDDDDFFPTLNQHATGLDLYETENEVVVKANVAGVPAEDVDITFEKNVLWIKASAREEEGDEKKKHYSKSSWSYSYKVSVPTIVDQHEEPQAEVEHGVVTITFKKSPASKARKLKVKAKN